ncbi:MAG: hypothetical protein ACRD9L_09935 [Bryobacteraceae bacterium]
MSIGNERLGWDRSLQRSEAASLAVCFVLLFCLNAAVASRLWSANFIDQMGSTAGPFIAISRYLMLHWSDHAWFPAWFCGIPFLRVYQPGQHVMECQPVRILSRT